MTGGELNQFRDAEFKFSMLHHSLKGEVILEAAYQMNRARVAGNELVWYEALDAAIDKISDLHKLE